MAQARFQLADISGWQGLVIVDVAVSAHAAATGPDGYNRAGLLEAKQAVYELLEHSAWDAYFTEDDAILARIAQDERAGIAAAKANFNDGATSEIYGQISDATKALESTLDTRMAQERAEMKDLRNASCASSPAAI